MDGRAGEIVDVWAIPGAGPVSIDEAWVRRAFAPGATMVMLTAKLRKLEAVGAIAVVAIFGSGPSAAQTQASTKITVNMLQQVSAGALLAV